VEAANNSEARWNGYLTRPTILHSSRWRGAEFQEVVRAPHGSFDLGASDLGLSWTRHPVKIRVAGRSAFEDIPPRPTLLPTSPVRGEWIGAGKSLIVFINEGFVHDAFHDKICRASDESLVRRSSQIKHLLNVLRLDTIARSPSGPALGEFAIVQMFQHVFPSSDSEKPARIDRVIECIHADLSKPLSLLDLAASADMSVRHLCRAFRAATGCAPHQFILRSRVERAKELLQKSNCSLIEVAEDVGFSSQAHMATAFRKLTGLTPSDFQIRRRNGETKARS
jgi:AraC-like DNA-binding protein